ncbi:MAG: amidohydrolase, partial [Phycisphaerae bacterium]
MKTSCVMSVVSALVLVCGLAAAQDLAVKAGRVHTGTGQTIENGVVLVKGGKIAAVGKAAEVAIPAGVKVLEAKVATPGLVDVRGTVGLSGILNARHDSDQLERSSPIQPELRAVDAYNPHEKLVE